MAHHIQLYMSDLKAVVLNVRSMALIQQKTLGKLVDDFTVNDFKTHLLSFGVVQEWKPIFSNFVMNNHFAPSRNITDSVTYAQEYFSWQQSTLSTLKSFIPLAAEKYIEICFKKLSGSTNDEWKTFRFKEIWLKAEQTLKSRLLNPIDYTELENKLEYFFLHTEPTDDAQSKLETFMKHTVAMMIYKQVVRKLPGELFQFVSSLDQVTEDSYYREKRHLLESIVQQCDSLYQMLPQLNVPIHGQKLFEVDQPVEPRTNQMTLSAHFYDPLIKRVSVMQDSLVNTEESPWKPVVAAEKSIDSPKRREIFSVVRVRTKPSKSETPVSSGASGANSFAYANEPSPPKYFSSQKEPRRRRFTADTDLLAEENPFSLPTIQRQLPTLKPSLLDTRQPTRTVYRSIFKK
jgi:hypothetical protein